MNKLIYILAGLLVVAGIFAAFVWYFASALSPSIPGDARIGSLDNEVTVDWYRYGASVSYTTSDLDAYRAMGFVHAARHPWFLSLLRQTAIGELGNWFAYDVAEMDSLVRVLDIPSSARQSISEISPRSSAILQAYSDGINGAFERARSYRDESFLAIDEGPGEWEPWHSVAIENLLAWISASERLSHSDSTASNKIIRSSLKLQDWLKVGGLNNSSAWSVQNGDSTVTGVRYVVGSSTVPLLVPVRVSGDNGLSSQHITILGTPFSLFTKVGDNGIAHMPRSQALFQTRLVDSTEIEISFDRIVNHEGQELLLSRKRIRGDLIQDCEPAQLSFFPGTGTPEIECTVLRWQGLMPSSDADAWVNQFDARAFKLWSGDAITFDKTGNSSSSTRTQAFPSAFGNRIRVSGDSRWTPFLRSRLVALTSEPEWADENLTRDVRSSWAEQMTQILLSSIDTTSMASPYVSPALSYLRNWDFTYSKSSIAASILDEWAVNMIRSGLDIINLNPDSVSKATGYFVDALSTLAGRFGSEMSDWRWETVNSHEYGYPGWSYIAADTLRRTETYRHILARKHSVPTLSGGHPSTLHWSPSPLSGAINSPATLYLSVTSTDWDALTMDVTTPGIGLTGDNATLEELINDFYSVNLSSQSPQMSTRLTP